MSVNLSELRQGPALTGLVGAQARELAVAILNAPTMTTKGGYTTAGTVHANGDTEHYGHLNILTPDGWDNLPDGTYALIRVEDTP